MLYLTPVISALQRLRQEDAASLRPAWATQEIPGKCVKKKKKSLGIIMFYLNPHIHWQQILTLNIATGMDGFLRMLTVPRKGLRAEQCLLGKSKCGHV